MTRPRQLPSPTGETASTHLGRVAFSVAVATALALTFAAGCKVHATGNENQNLNVNFNTCPPGDVRCSGSSEERCNADGTGWTSTPCEEACVDGQGCVACVEESLYCDLEDPLQVLRCDGGDLLPDHRCEDGEGCRLGSCMSLCDPEMLSRSNEGCEFWAVDLDNWYGTDAMNPDASGEQFSAVVTNLNDFAVMVTVEINQAEPGEPLDLAVIVEQAVAPGDLVQIDLPQREVDGSVLNQNDGTGTALTSHAFHITSTGPIVAYQFNPSYQMFSNDASILIPQSGLDVRYWAMGYPGIGVAANPINPESTNYSFLTIVGTQAETHVTITLSADIAPGGPVADFTPAGSVLDVTLGAFDVLNLEAHCPPDQGQLDCMQNGLTDFTGTLVEADAPVAVFAGNECVNVSSLGGLGGCCCDHMEDQMLPTSALGQSFVGSHSPYRGGSEPDLWRVLADYDNTEVVVNGQTINLESGQWYAFDAFVDFVLVATKPVQLAQYLLSQDGTSAIIGDPAMTLFSPVEQFRDRYIFLVPETFDEDYAVIVRPEDTAVSMDGMQVPGEMGTACSVSTAGEIEGVSYEVLRCQVEDGVHRITASAPVGLTVYGYGPAGSYAFPGGADVRQINIPQ